MRIIIFAFCFVFISGLCRATEMCARNDTVVIPLDASVGVKTTGNNANEFIWWVTFEGEYKIYGVRTMLSAAEGKPDTNTSAGLIGEDANGNSRTVCWCRMTHPMKSGWFRGYANSTSQCCTHILAPGYAGPAVSLATIKSMFDSIGKK